jgi:hypothetical protein
MDKIEAQGKAMLSATVSASLTDEAREYEYMNDVVNIVSG